MTIPPVWWCDSEAATTNMWQICVSVHKSSWGVGAKDSTSSNKAAIFSSKIFCNNLGISEEIRQKIYYTDEMSITYANSNFISFN